MRAKYIRQGRRGDMHGTAANFATTSRTNIRDRLCPSMRRRSCFMKENFAQKWQRCCAQKWKANGVCMAARERHRKASMSLPHEGELRANVNTYCAQEWEENCPRKYNLLHESELCVVESGVLWSTVKALFLRVTRWHITPRGAAFSHRYGQPHERLRSLPVSVLFRVGSA